MPENYNKYRAGQLSTDIDRPPTGLTNYDRFQQEWECYCLGLTVSHQTNWSQGYTDYMIKRFGSGPSSSTGTNSIKYSTALAKGEGLAYGDSKWTDRKFLLGLRFIHDPVEFLRIDFNKLKSWIPDFHTETKRIKNVDKADTSNGHIFGSCIQHLINFQQKLKVAGP